MPFMHLYVCKIYYRIRTKIHTVISEKSLGITTANALYTAHDITAAVMLMLIPLPLFKPTYKLAQCRIDPRINPERSGQEGVMRMGAH